MKRVYQAPQMEVIEIELENILCARGDDSGVTLSTVKGDESAW